MRSLTRKILLTVSGVVLAAALAVGLVLAFTGSGTTFAASASGFSVGGTDYSSFGSAWSAAESGTTEYTSTIVLNENVSPSSTYTVKAEENVILDLNGYSINIKSKGKLVDVYGTFTLTDNTATAGKYTGSSKVGVYSSSTGYMTVYEADDGTGTDTLCKYYYTSGAIYGASSSSNSVGVVMAYEGGVFNMEGGSIVSNTYTPTNINTAQTAVVYADKDSTFNMTAGSISGNTSTNTVTVYLKGSGNLHGGVISGNTDDNDGTVYAATGLTVGREGKDGGPVISGNSSLCGAGIAALCDLYMYGGEICCNTATGSGLFGSGAGIYILDANFYMYGGTIHDNDVTSTSYGGGGVFSYGSTSTRYVVELSGGDIYNNYAYENGGGVLAYYVDVIMYDGMKIRKNESRFGAGVYTANVTPYATFTMYGGEISDNKANQSGGASYCYGTTTIYGGLVSGNTAVTGGGAFYVRTQPFAIEGGTFTGNSSSGTGSNSGGGVFSTADSSSSVTVTGGTFTDNYSAGYGGAMSFYAGAASISGVTVTDNTAGKYGGGIYVRTKGTVSFSGYVYVRDNYVGETRENVFLDSSDTVSLTGALTDGSYIGVYIYSSTQTQVTASESGTSYYLEALRYFHSDVLFDGQYLGYGDSYIELKSGSDVARVDSPSSATSTFYTSVSSALDAARATSSSDAGTAVLLSSFTVPSYSGDAWYEVGASYFVTLDLNGYNIVLDSTNIRAFSVSGNFTLTDSWEAYRYLGTSGTLGATSYSSLGSYETVYRYTEAETGEVGYWRYTSGAIYGAWSYEDDEEHNGVVKVSKGGTFSMLGGTLTGNRSWQGSGVSVYGGTFKMYGGVISYNTGIAVYAKSGDFIMNGGVITGTSEGYYGSAIRITGAGTLYIKETEDCLTLVSENESYQGAIYVEDGSKAYIEGGNIEFNTASRDGGALYVKNSEAEISGGYIANNTAGYSGGAVYVNTSDLTMTGGVISGNTANGGTNGGKEYSAAVFVRYGTFVMIDGEISGNVSTNSSSYGGGVNVSISTFTMIGGSIYGNTSTYASGVYVYSSGSNAKSSFTMTGGSIYDNTAGNGAGVYVDNYADFEMSGGEIYENEATQNGFAGVYVTNSSSFTMTGGEIFDNYGTWGGGVGVYYSSSFTMTEGSTGSIHGNIAEQYAGGVTVSESTFDMDGGEIYGNSARANGGVCVMFSTATFTMYGGKIYGNTATTSYAGGVTIGNGATFDMYGGEIYDNSAATYGGGVAVLGSNTFNMYGGEIYSNTATTNGGGISTNSGASLTIAGGSIEGNYASGNGGGVYATSTLTMSGKVTIQNNTSPSGNDNLYLPSSSVYVALGGEITSGSYIGLSLYSSTKTQITTAETETELYKNSAKYFHLDDDNLAYTYYVGYKSGNYVEILSFEDGAVIVEHADGSMEVASSAEEALQNAVSGDTVILYDDVVWSDCDFGSNVWYEVESGFELTIDLNGHNIELDSDAYRAFRVYGTLNLTDSSAVYSEYTGSLDTGVYQNDDGTFTTIFDMSDEETLETSTYSYTSGAIYGGRNTTNSTQYLGAIYVGENGALNIYGGTICGNSYCHGGGVYVRGGATSTTGAYFAMYGGSISGNTTTRHGSALFFGYNTDAYIYGGIITSNSANTTNYGGAIYTYDGADVYISEDTDFPTVVSHNTAYYGAALAFSTDTVCVIDGGHFEFNYVTRDGGALYTWKGAEVTINGGLFAYNTAAYSGGALYIRDALDMYGGFIYGNTSTTTIYGGGAVGVYDSTGYFRMYGGEISGNEATSHYGGGVYTGNGAVFEMYGGKIINNTASSDGGGIYLDDTGSTVYLYGGTVSGNEAANGGGVYVTSGALYVVGGYIDGNFATYGGGVYSCDDVYIYDGGVTGNYASKSGGGLYMDKNTSLVIEDGCIYGNEAKSYGGGVDSKAGVTMNGGYVSGNTAGVDGGGIYVSSNGYDTSMTMTGGHVTYNVSNGTSWGGGGIVANYDTTFVMTGGEIACNTAAAGGAGVYLGHGSTFTMTGGEIRENTSGKDAAGIFTQTCTCHDICEIELGGKAVVRDNVLTSGEKSNVVLIEGQYITLVSDLERGSYIGFTLASGTRVTSAESVTSYYINSYAYFQPDDDSLTVGYSSTGRYVEIIDATGAVAAVRLDDGTIGIYSSYEEALKYARDNSGTVVLLRDIHYDTDYAKSTGFVLGGAYSMSLDLNGHSIYLSSDYSQAFDVVGSFSLYDSTGYYSEYSGNLSEGVYDNEDGTFTTIYRESDADTCETKLYSYTSGAITGGDGAGTSRYGAIYVEGGGTLSIYGGTICGNTYNYGGGIYILGAYNSSGRDTVFNMYGGSVSGNTATNQGGGIIATFCYVSIYGGIISKNTASSIAGGIAIVSDEPVYIGTPSDAATAALCDVAPVISDNYAGTYGGGLHINCASEVTVSGAHIEYNTSGSGGAGIYMSNTEASTFANAFIGYNTSATTGGGIYVVTGEVTYSSGKIYFNTAESTGYGGAGVYVSSKASFSLTGGTVSQNVTAGYGGGVYLESGANLLVSNAEISFNTAASMGGGVYALGTLSVSGEAVIRDNTAAGLEENVLLSANNYIVLAGTLSGDAYIGVSFADSTQTQITSQEETTTRYRSAYRYFVLDIDADKYFVYYSASRYVVIIPSGEIFVIVTDSEGGETYYTTIEDAWTAALSGDPDAINTITLNGDVSPAETLTVASGEYLALDLNGHTIFAPSSSSAAEISGTLYMYDSTEVYSFGIEYSGEAAVVDNGDGTFTTYYATIADIDTGEKQWNTYTSGGITGLNEGTSVGAVRVSGGGVLEMYGGSVVLNETGPAIYMTSGSGNPTLRMYGGSVSGNTGSGTGAAAIGSSNGYMYIYSGIIAANDAIGDNGEIISADGASYLYLGTDDESVLSALKESNPDAYEAGVILSGNYVGNDGLDRFIYMSFSAKTFAMYDRVEISYNYQNASDRGFIQISAGTGYFYGGTIAWNTTGETYGVIQYVERAYFYGDIYIGHNTSRTDDEGEEHGNLYGSSFRIDDSFTGVIYVSTELSSDESSSSLKVTNGAATEDIYSHVLSDRGYCRGIDTYLCFYYKHTNEQTILAYEDGVFVVYDVCLDCGDIIQRYVIGEEDNNYEVKFRLDDDGNVEAYVTNPNSTTGEDLCSVTMDGGYLVTSGTGDDATYTWYEDISEAIESLTDGDTLTLYEDTNLSGNGITVEADGVTVDLNGNSLVGDVTITGDGSSLELSGGNVIGSVTVSGSESSVDLGGGTITGDFTVGENSSVTVSDSSDDAGGYVGGDIIVENGSTLGITGGNFADTEDAVKYFDPTTGDDGSNKVIYVTDGGETYGIVSEGDINSDEGNGKTAEASVTVTVDCKEYTYYFESFADAVEFLSVSGGTIKLESDAVCVDTITISSDIEIDLNGHTLSADFLINAKGGYDESQVSLKIADSSLDDENINTKGSLVGTIKVTGSNTTDTEGSGSSYAETLSIPSAVYGNSKISVDLTELTGSGVAYGLTDGSTTGTYSITTGHTHDYSNNVTKVFTYNSDGTVTYIVKCACGEVQTYTESDEGKVYGDTCVYTGYIVGYTYDNMIGQSVVLYVSSTNGGQYEDMLVIEPVAMVQYTDASEETVTMFFESFEDAEAYAEKILGSDTASAAVLTLLGNASNVNVSNGKLTINLNGYNLTGSVSVTSGAEVTVTGDGATVDNYSEGSEGTTSKEVSSGKNGYTDVVVSCDETSTFEITGGYIAEENLEYLETYVGNGYVIVYESGRYAVISAEEASQNAVAYIVDSDGNATYYLTLQDAVDAAEDGDTVFIAKDLTASEGGSPASVGVYGKDITIDLNGHTLGADIEVDGTSSVTLKDTSAGGTGLLSGEISGSGDITVESGSYTTDVGEYLASNKSLYAEYDESTGTVTYTVIDKYGSGEAENAVASVTRTDSEGNTYTVYYESIVGALADLEDGDTLTLLTDVGTSTTSQDVEFKSEDGTINVTLDLNGNKVYGALSVDGNTNLTIVDSSAGFTGGVGGSYDSGSGSVTGNVTLAEDGSLTVEGGTYSQDMSEYAGDEYAVVVSYTDDEATYTVMNEKEAQKKAEASVTYTDEKGEEHTLYFEDSSSAIAWAGENSSDGSSVTVTLYDDIDSGVSVEKGNVIINLNGHDIEGGISVSEGATLTVTGEGEVSDTITNNGTFVADGGTYSSDVSQYLPSDGDKVILVVTTEDDEGETVTSYEVVSETEAQDRAAASVTVETMNGDGEVTSTTTTYYEDIEDALKAVSEMSKSGSGDTTEGTTTDYTLTLWDDVNPDDLTADDDGNTSLTLDGDFTFDMNGYDVNTDIDIAAGSEINIDLGGGTVDGGITVGVEDEQSGDTGSGSASLTITDSSEDGSGAVNGDITSSNEENDISVEGGTYGGSTGIDEYIPDGSEAVKGSDGSTTVVPSEEAAESISGAYVAEYDDEGNETGRTYYESAEDAIRVAAANGGTVILLDDAYITNLTISESVVIDLNGHSLYIEAEIEADSDTDEDGEIGEGEYGAGGSLKITDSSEKYDDNGDLAQEATGSVAGSVTVKGSGDAATGEDNPYENTLVFDGGANPGNGLNITLDLSSGGTSSESGDAAYVFGDIPDENGNSTGKYGIYVDEGHTHSYEIEVWVRNDDGSVTLILKCSCGAEDENYIYTIGAEDLVMTDNGDGTYTVTGVVKDGNGNEVKDAEGNSYEYTDTRTIVATFTDGDDTYYFDSLQDAVDFVTESKTEGLVIVLETDTDEDVEVKSGSAEIDLNGNAMNGTTTVEDGASLTIDDSSEKGTGSVNGDMTVSGGELNLDGGTYEGNIDVTDGGSLNVSEDADVNSNITVDGESTFTTEGGTYAYTDENLDSVTDALGNMGDEWCAYVTDEGTIIITNDSETVQNATVVIVKENGAEIYYDSLEDALSDLESGDTLVLLEDIAEDESLVIYGDISVTVDLNGKEILGSVTVSGGADVTITGDGYVESVSVEEGSNLTIQGGTYSDWNSVAGYTDSGNGYVVFVEDGYKYTVMTEDDAENTAEAKTSSHDESYSGDIYFENLQDAVDYAAGKTTDDGDAETVTLVSDTEGNITVTGDVVIDLDGNLLGGDIIVESETEFTITDSSEDGSGTVSGLIYAEKGTVDVTGGETIVNVDGGTVEGGVYGGDNTEVNVSGGTVDGDIKTGDDSSVTVTDGTVTGDITTGDNSEVTVSGSDVEGGITAGDDSTVTVEEGEDGDGSRVGGDISTGKDSEVTVSGSDVEGGISTGNGAADEDTDGSSVTVEGGSYVGGDITTGNGSASVYPSGDGVTPSVEVTDSTVDGGISAGDYSGVTIDGSTVNGDISTGTNSELEASDSTLNGGLDLGDDTDYDFGGTVFGDGSVLDDLEGYVGVVTGDGTYAAVSEDDLEGYADAYVEAEDGSKTYYENIADAIAAAEENGGKVVLVSDVTCDETIDIYGDVEIDTNGFILNADIVIHADKETYDEDGETVGTEYGAGGSLTVSDSTTEYDEDGNVSKSGTGSLSGSITVEGDGDIEGDNNPYEETLTFTDGVTPGADLSVDLSELGSNGGEYVLEYDETSGDFVISSSDGHEHSYDIEVWEFDENGVMTLKFMCACGEYESDEGYNAVLTIKYNETNDTIEYTYTVEVKDESDSRYGQTFEKVVVYNVAASVTDETTGEEHRFASVQDAVDYVLDNGGSVTLENDYSGDLVITVGEGDTEVEIEIDLAGHTYEGSVSVPDGATLTFTDSSYDSTSEDSVKGGVTITGGDVDGTLVLDGVDVTLTGDLDVSDGTLEIEGDVEINLGDSTLTAVPEISDGSSLTVTGGEGSGLVLSGDMTLDGGTSLTIGGDADFSLGGFDFTVAEAGDEPETKAGSFTLTDNASLTLDGGNFTGDIVVEGADSSVTIDVGKGSCDEDTGDTTGYFEGSVSGDGSVTVTIGEGGSFDGGIEVKGNAEVSVDAGTYTGNVTSDGGDVLVNVTGGGSFTGDIITESNDEGENGTVEILVDGENSVIDGNITSSGDASITVTGDGTIKTSGTSEEGEEENTGISIGGNADISVNGGEIASDIAVSGDADIDVTNGGAISGDTTVSGKADVDMDKGTISGDTTFEGDADVSVGSGSTISGSMTFEGDSSLDLAGGTVSGEEENADAKITVGGSGSLSITDSSTRNTGTIDTAIEVANGGSLEMHDGTYTASVDDDGNVTGSPSVTVSEGDENEGTPGYVFVSAAEEDGTVYYETMTKDAHEKLGHGYDKITGCTFDAETATVTFTYTCLCGESGTFTRKLEYGVDYTTKYETTVDGTAATVTVEYTVAEYVEAPNGVVYPVMASGAETLTELLNLADSGTEENDYNKDGNNKFTLSRTQTASCYQGGVDTYTYGESGVTVVVTSGAVHTGYKDDTDHHWTVNGVDVYYCDACESYYIGSISATSENGYSKDGYEAEMEKYEEFVNSVDDATSALEKLYEDFGISEEDKYGAGDALQSALDALEALEYEFLGDGSTVSDRLSEEIQEILDEAELAITNAALAENAEIEINNIYREILASLDETGELSEEIENAMADELEAILSDLTHVKASSTSDEDLSVFDTFIESATRDLLSVFTTKNVSSSAASESGFEAGLTVTEGDGFSGTIELVIEDVFDEGFYAWLLANSTFTYYVDGEVSYDYTSEELESMVIGKGVVAVFDIYLKDSFSDVKVYVFSGKYVVSVTLPENIANKENLLVVYVGDDGKTEIYETYVEDGILYFTTTHFSEFVLLGDADAETEYVVGGTGTTAGTTAGGEEKETDLTAAIIALAVVDVVLLILGIVLLIILLMRKGKIGGKKSTAAVGLFALLAVVPAGGLAITIVLGVLALAFLAADIYLIYGIFTTVPVVEYVEGGNGEGETAVDTNGDITLSSGEENEGEDEEDR